MTARRPVIVVSLLVILVFAALAVTRRGARSTQLEATGTVEATETALGFTVPGRVERIAVQEGDTVVAGATIAGLDRSEYLARREQAQAEILAARAQLLELEHGSRPEEVTAARAAERAAADRFAEAQREAERARTLRDSDLISAQQLEQTVTALELARSALEQARAQLRLVELGPRRERIEAARARVAAAEAAVRSIDATLAQMEVRAPFAGIVTVRHHEPGEIVAAGVPIVSVLDPGDRWVRIYVPEDRIGSVHVGQKAAITSDTFRGRRDAGRVVAIASEAEFTPKTVQTREERVKLVYAVKVRIEGDPRHDLKPGMPADVALEGLSR